MRVPAKPLEISFHRAMVFRGGWGQDYPEQRVAGREKMGSRQGGIGLRYSLDMCVCSAGGGVCTASKQDWALVGGRHSDTPGLSYHHGCGRLIKTPCFPSFLSSSIHPSLIDLPGRPVSPSFPRPFVFLYLHFFSFRSSPHTSSWPLPLNQSHSLITAHIYHSHRDDCLSE